MPKHTRSKRCHLRWCHRDYFSCKTPRRTGEDYHLCHLAVLDIRHSIRQLSYHPFSKLWHKLPLSSYSIDDTVIKLKITKRYMRKKPKPAVLNRQRQSKRSLPTVFRLPFQLNNQQVSIGWPRASSVRVEIHNFWLTRTRVKKENQFFQQTISTKIVKFGEDALWKKQTKKSARHHASASGGRLHNPDDTTREETT